MQCLTECCQSGLTTDSGLFLSYFRHVRSKRASAGWYSSAIGSGSNKNASNPTGAKPTKGTVDTTGSPNSQPGQGAEGRRVPPSQTTIGPGLRRTVGATPSSQPSKRPGSIASSSPSTPSTSRPLSSAMPTASGATNISALRSAADYQTQTGYASLGTAVPAAASSISQFSHATNASPTSYATQSSARGRVPQTHAKWSVKVLSTEKLAAQDAHARYAAFLNKKVPPSPTPGPSAQEPAPPSSVRALFQSPDAKPTVETLEPTVAEELPQPLSSLSPEFHTPESRALVSHASPPQAPGSHTSTQVASASHDPESHASASLAVRSPSPPSPAREVINSPSDRRPSPALSHDLAASRAPASPNTTDQAARPPRPPSPPKSSTHRLSPKGSSTVLSPHHSSPPRPYSPTLSHPSSPPSPSAAQHLHRNRPGSPPSPKRLLEGRLPGSPDSPNCLLEGRLSGSPQIPNRLLEGRLSGSLQSPKRLLEGRLSGSPLSANRLLDGRLSGRLPSKEPFPIEPMHWENGSSSALDEDSVVLGDYELSPRQTLEVPQSTDKLKPDIAPISPISEPPSSSKSFTQSHPFRKTSSSAAPASLAAADASNLKHGTLAARAPSLSRPSSSIPLHPFHKDKTELRRQVSLGPLVLRGLVSEQLRPTFSGSSGGREASPSARSRFSGTGEVSASSAAGAQGGRGSSASRGETGERGMGALEMEDSDKMAEHLQLLQELELLAARPATETAGRSIMPKSQIGRQSMSLQARSSPYVSFPGLDEETNQDLGEARPASVNGALPLSYSEARRKGPTGFGSPWHASDVSGLRSSMRTSVSEAGRGLWRPHQPRTSTTTSNLDQAPQQPIPSTATSSLDQGPQQPRPSTATSSLDQGPHQRTPGTDGGGSRLPVETSVAGGATDVHREMSLAALNAEQAVARAVRALVGVDLNVFNAAFKLTSAGDSTPRSDEGSMELNERGSMDPTDFKLKRQLWTSGRSCPMPEYLSHGGHFKSEGGSTMSDGGRFKSEGGGTMSDSGRFKSEGGGTMSDGGRFKSEEGGTMSDGGRFKSEGDMAMSSAESRKSGESSIRFNGGSVRSEGSSIQLDGFSVRSDRDGRDEPTQALDISREEKRSLSLSQNNLLFISSFLDEPPPPLRSNLGTALVQGLPPRGHQDANALVANPVAFRSYLGASIPVANPVAVGFNLGASSPVATPSAFGSNIGFRTSEADPITFGSKIGFRTSEADPIYFGSKACDRTGVASSTASASSARALLKSHHLADLDHEWEDEEEDLPPGAPASSAGYTPPGAVTTSVDFTTPGEATSGALSSSPHVDQSTRASRRRVERDASTSLLTIMRRCKNGPRHSSSRNRAPHKYAHHLRATRTSTSRRQSVEPSTANRSPPTPSTDAFLPDPHQADYSLTAALPSAFSSLLYAIPDPQDHARYSGYATPDTQDHATPDPQDHTRYSGHATPDTQDHARYSGHATPDPREQLQTQQPGVSEARGSLGGSGARGSQGEPGARGIQGGSGARGSQGDPGARGSQGGSGAQGRNSQGPQRTQQLEGSGEGAQGKATPKHEFPLSSSGAKSSTRHPPICLAAQGTGPPAQAESLSELSLGGSRSSTPDTQDKAHQIIRITPSPAVSIRPLSLIATSSRGGPLETKVAVSKNHVAALQPEETKRTQAINHGVFGNVPGEMTRTQATDHGMFGNVSRERTEWQPRHFDAAAAAAAFGADDAGTGLLSTRSSLSQPGMFEDYGGSRGLHVYGTSVDSDMGSIRLREPLTGKAQRYNKTYLSPSAIHDDAASEIGSTCDLAVRRMSHIINDDSMMAAFSSYLRRPSMTGSEALSTTSTNYTRLSQCVTANQCANRCPPRARCMYGGGAAVSWCGGSLTPRGGLSPCATELAADGSGLGGRCIEVEGNAYPHKACPPVLRAEARPRSSYMGGRYFPQPAADARAFVSYNQEARLAVTSQAERHQVSEARLGVTSQAERHQVPEARLAVTSQAERHQGVQFEEPRRSHNGYGKREISPIQQHLRNQILRQTSHSSLASNSPRPAAARHLSLEIGGAASHASQPTGVGQHARHLSLEIGNAASHASQPAGVGQQARHLSLDIANAASHATQPTGGVQQATHLSLDTANAASHASQHSGVGQHARHLSLDIGNAASHATQPTGGVQQARHSSLDIANAASHVSQHSGVGQQARHLSLDIATAASHASQPTRVGQQDNVRDHRQWRLNNTGEFPEPSSSVPMKNMEGVSGYPQTHPPRPLPSLQNTLGEPGQGSTQPQASAPHEQSREQGSAWPWGQNNDLSSGRPPMTNQLSSGSRGESLQLGQGHSPFSVLAPPQGQSPNVASDPGLPRGAASAPCPYCGPYHAHTLKAGDSHLDSHLTTSAGPRAGGSHLDSHLTTPAGPRAGESHLDSHFTTPAAPKAGDSHLDSHLITSAGPRTGESHLHSHFTMPAGPRAGESHLDSHFTTPAGPRAGDSHLDSHLTTSAGPRAGESHLNSHFTTPASPRAGESHLDSHFTTPAGPRAGDSHLDSHLTTSAGPRAGESHLNSHFTTPASPRAGESHLDSHLTTPAYAAANILTLLEDGLHECNSAGAMVAPSVGPSTRIQEWLFSSLELVLSDDDNLDLFRSIRKSLDSRPSGSVAFSGFQVGSILGDSPARSRSTSFDYPARPGKTSFERSRACNTSQGSLGDPQRHHIAHAAPPDEPVALFDINLAKYRFQGTLSAGQLDVDVSSIEAHASDTPRSVADLLPNAPGYVSPWDKAQGLDSAASSPVIDLPPPGSGVSSGALPSKNRVQQGRVHRTSFESVASASMQPHRLKTVSLPSVPSSDLAHLYRAQSSGPQALHRAQDREFLAAVSYPSSQDARALDRFQSGTTGGRINPASAEQAGRSQPGELGTGGSRIHPASLEQTDYVHAAGHSPSHNPTPQEQTTDGGMMSPIHVQQPHVDSPAPKGLGSNTTTQQQHQLTPVAAASAQLLPPTHEEFGSNTTTQQQPQLTPVAASSAQLRPPTHGESGSNATTQQQYQRPTSFGVPLQVSSKLVVRSTPFGLQAAYSLPLAAHSQALPQASPLNAPEEASPASLAPYQGDGRQPYQEDEMYASPTKKMYDPPTKEMYASPTRKMCAPPTRKMYAPPTKEMYATHMCPFLLSNQLTFSNRYRLSSNHRNPPLIRSSSQMRQYMRQYTIPSC
eukprot:gene16312-22500_t